MHKGTLNQILTGFLGITLTFLTAAGALKMPAQAEAELVATKVLTAEAGLIAAEAAETAEPAKEEETKGPANITIAPDGRKLSDDASDFVLLSEAVPDAILEIRYYSTYNFVGERIDGYEEPLAILTKEAAMALKEVSDDLVEQGYRLKIFDAYRPQKAVDHFMEWALDAEDVRMKRYFYPELEKDVLFPLGYIAEYSGHSRGSTVDLTLFDMTTEKEVDMGGTFDYFGELSHPSYMDITEEQYQNRMILRDAMLAHGFKPIEEEWWHFTLADEPYTDIYFTFPVNSESVEPYVPGVTCGIYSVNQYGNVILDIPAEELDKKGYEAGDIVLVQIGEKYWQMPYGTNYSDVNPGYPVLVSRKGSLIVSLNQRSFALAAGLSEDSVGVPVFIEMDEKAGYLRAYQARSMTYSLDRQDFESDEAFANFREVKMGEIGEHVLYRSASGLDNSNKRAATVSALYEKNGIQTAVNLSESKEDMEAWMAAEDFDSAYYKQLYESGQVITNGALPVDAMAESFQTGLAADLRGMLEKKAPYAIHCQEGKDRTGFVLILLEALMGASYEEMMDDYMQSFINYYHLTKGDERYEIIKDSNATYLFMTLTGVEHQADLAKADYKAAAKTYLAGIGLSEEEIKALQDCLK